MKSFRTTLPEYRAASSLSHADQLVLVGSCFAEHIGNRLADMKFSTLLNPNGILYNPVSVSQLLKDLRNAAFTLEPPAAPSLFQHQGLWHSWEHHGHFSHPDRDQCLQGIEQAGEQAAGFLKKTNWLILTLGSAQVFTLRENGQVVANNHKAPADWFTPRRLSVAETVAALQPELEALKAELPALQVVLTVSPVRHLRNGLIENQRSKAVLLLAVEQLCEQLDFVDYFPAYELLQDDLRDYRFYAADMTHPGAEAIDYIWAYFSAAYFSPATRDLIEQIVKLRRAAQHRPFHPDTAAHRQFLQQQLKQVRNLAGKYPELDFSEEIRVFTGSAIE